MRVHVLKLLNPGRGCRSVGETWGNITGLYPSTSRSERKMGTLHPSVGPGGKGNHYQSSRQEPLGKLL